MENANRFIFSTNGILICHKPKKGIAKYGSHKLLSSYPHRYKAVSIQVLVQNVLFLVNYGFDTLEKNSPLDLSERKWENPKLVPENKDGKPDFCFGQFMSFIESIYLLLLKIV
jgi:hypothetical protein